MRNDKAIHLWALAVAVLLLAAFAGVARAEWHTVLDEHFNIVQRGVDDSHTWPWWTDINANRRWHWNPRPPHLRAQQVYTDYCWGIQDFIYNSKVTRNEDRDEHMSLWCCRTNRNDVQHPFYPDDDKYQNDQNAWAWWGPFDLRKATKAAVHYWNYMLLDHPVVGDYMAVLATNDVGMMTYTDADLLDQVPWGRIHNRVTEDWTDYTVYLDSLYLGVDTLTDSVGTPYFAGKDSVSIVGSDHCWIAFVWRTNSRDIGGFGAFVDDITVSWDDGLFNILPDKLLFGYPVGEDSVRWVTQMPATGEDVYIGLRWKIFGSEGEVPEFTNALFIDDEKVYSETKNIVVDLADTTSMYYFSHTTSFWTVPADTHYVKWVLDLDSTVTESNERDNTSLVMVENEWNPPPQAEFLSVANAEIPDTALTNAKAFPILIDISDSLLTDDSFTLTLFYTKDTSGYSILADTMFYWPVCYTNYSAARGENICTWNINDAYKRGYVAEGDLYYIVAMVADRKQGNVTIVFSPGRVLIVKPEAVGEESPVPEKFGITAAYPNPFNRSMNLEYGLRHAGTVRLGVYDLAGREVAQLAGNWQAAGQHRIQWAPVEQSAGVYLMRLEANGEVYLHKAVYMP